MSCFLQNSILFGDFGLSSPAATWRHSVCAKGEIYLNEKRNEWRESCSCNAYRCGNWILRLSLRWKLSALQNTYIHLVTCTEFRCCHLVSRLQIACVRFSRSFLSIFLQILKIEIEYTTLSFQRRLHASCKPYSIWCLRPVCCMSEYVRFTECARKKKFLSFHCCFK